MDLMGRCNDVQACDDRILVLDGRALRPEALPRDVLDAAAGHRSIVELRPPIRGACEYLVIATPPERRQDIKKTPRMQRPRSASGRRPPSTTPVDRALAPAASAARGRKLVAGSSGRATAARRGLVPNRPLTLVRRPRFGSHGSRMSRALTANEAARGAPVLARARNARANHATHLRPEDEAFIHALRAAEWAAYLARMACRLHRGRGHRNMRLRDEAEAHTHNLVRERFLRYRDAGLGAVMRLLRVTPALTLGGQLTATVSAAWAGTDAVARAKLRPKNQEVRDTWGLGAKRFQVRWLRLDGYLFGQVVQMRGPWPDIRQAIRDVGGYGPCWRARPIHTTNSLTASRASPPWWGRRPSQRLVGWRRR